LKRTVSAMLMASVILLLSVFVPSTAAADSGGRVVWRSPDGSAVRKVHEFDSGGPSFVTTFKRADAAGGHAGTLQDPPLGQCYGQINGQVNADYLDGLLEHTESTFYGETWCNTTAPGQSMRHMSATSELHQIVNGSNVVRKEAPTGECSKEQTTDPDCLRAVSTTTDNCFTYTFDDCHGTYYASVFYSLLLPDGWVWSTWPPFCDLVFQTELYCVADTATTYVFPTA
jgi:hypothetical protein